jgi:Protein of unknown function (DUF3500)
MKPDLNLPCPECDAAAGPGILRRDFMRMTGGLAATALLSNVNPALAQNAVRPAALAARQPAEALVRELHAGLNDWQRRHVVYPWNHMGSDGSRIPVRLRTYNTCIGKAIGETYTRGQRELIERILQAISSGEDGYRQITRNGSWDSNDGILSGGAYIFGDPTTNQYCFLFAGHHLTVRCDGNSEPDVPFGGPIFYGHIVSGYSQRNVFNYQTRSALAVFDALTENQRRRALVRGRPSEAGNGPNPYTLRGRGDTMPGIRGGELSADQRRLLEGVMRTLLSPYRKEDVDEVMEIVRANGGLDNIHLAFYENAGGGAAEPWTYWRLEGPGFVWCYRVLPHVHTFVNIRRLPNT